MLPGVGIFGHSQLALPLTKLFIQNNFPLAAIWCGDLADANNLLDACCLPEHQRNEVFISSNIDQVILCSRVVLVVITSASTYLHSEITCKACHIGKHVVCSLPPARSMVEMNFMYQAAINYPSLISMVTSPLRFLPVASLMKRLVQVERLIGKVSLITGQVNCNCLISSEFA